MKITNLAATALRLAALLPSLAEAQNAFAHVIVGNTASYDVNQWQSDIQLASSYGIDGFALNIGTPLDGNTATQISNALSAANNLAGTLPTDFKCFFMFDYLGGSAGPWPADTVSSLLSDYYGNGAYFTVDGKPLVSTFEGVDNRNDWPGIRSALPGDIYFVPDWTSLGPTGFDLSLVDGAFSWDMWPDGPVDISTDHDNNWDANWLAPNGKSYMMGVSPWFYTDLSQYSKAWVWRGDSSWSIRWDQTHDVKPQFIQIVTWNDYGESHYIGPIVDAGIPNGAATYVDGYTHQAWLETLPYEIAAYKAAYSGGAAPSIAAGSDKIVYWYRTSPASAGSTDVAGNDCKTASNPGGYQTCYSITDMLEDEVFAVVLASQAGTATISIGGASSSYQVNAGKNFISMPFNGATGTVSVSLGSISGSGVDITSAPASGTANFNAYVACAGSCSSS